MEMKHKDSLHLIAVYVVVHLYIDVPKNAVCNSTKVRRTRPMYCEAKKYQMYARVHLTIDCPLNGMLS
jgi:hypothetical protein